MKRITMKHRKWLSGVLMGALAVLAISSVSYGQVTNFPFEEGFENAGSIPTSWTQENLSGTTNWSFVGSNQNSSVSSRTGSYLARFYVANYNDERTRLITPALDITGLTDPRLIFYYTQVDWGGDQDTLGVYYRTSATGTWTYLTSFSSSVSSWTEVVVDLPNGSADYYIAFEGYSGYGRGVTLDDVTVEETPSCLTPSGLTASAITASSAELDWTENGTATTWYVEYGTGGFTQGSGTTVTVTARPYDLTGLSDETEYDYYVRAFCSAGDTSSWSSAFTFTTECNAFSAPFTESFDGTSLPDCWDAYELQGSGWVVGSPGFTWNTSGCSATPSDHTGNSGNFAALDFSLPDEGSTIELPDVDVSSLTVPELSFVHFMCGTGYSPLNKTYIEAYNGSGWDMVDSVDTGSASWEEYSYDLSSFKHGSNLVRVRFRAESGGSSNVFYGDVAIDDIEIKEQPNCVKPTTLAATNLTSSSADLSWTEVNTATSWEIATVISGTTFDNVGDSVVSSSSLTVDGLSLGTTYDFYVRSICGVGDTSEWSGPFAFDTECGAYPAPYSQTFDRATLPNCWAQSATTGGPWVIGTATFWNTGGCGSRPTDHNANGGNFAALDHSGSDVGVVIEMPIIDVSTLTTPQLRFYHFMCTESYSPPNEVHVEAYNGTDWSLVALINDGSNSWEEYTYDLSSFTYGTDSVRIRFRGESGGSGSDFNGDVAIDDIHIEEAPTCPRPTDLTVTATTGTTATVAWTDNSTAATWYLEYGDVGFALGTGTTLTANVDTTIITGLMSNSGYDVYVRAFCAVGDTSDWSAVETFQTECEVFSTLPFLETFDDTSATTNCWSDTILVGNFAWDIGTDNGSSMSGNGMAFFDDDAAGSNQDNEATFFSPIFDLSSYTGARLSFDYMLNTASAGESLSVDVWNGSSWVNVLIVDEETCGSWDCTHPTADINISDHLNSEMQVRFVFNDGIGATWGWYAGVDNFEIKEIFPNDVALTNIDANGCTDDESVTLQIVNFGSASQTSIPVSYSVNGGTVINETWTGTLAPEDTTEYTFTVTFDAETTGDYDIEAYTALSGDANVADDSLGITVTTTPTYSVMFTEDFEGSTAIPTDWTSTGFVTNGHNSGSNVIYANLWSNTQEFEVVLPKVDNIVSGDEFRFMYRYVNFSGNGTVATNLGNGDTLNVLISTDCGQNYFILDQIHGGNHTASADMTAVGYDLSAYAGETVRLALFATWGTGDYYLDIDHVIIGEPLVASITASSDVDCFGDIDGDATVSATGGVTPYAYEWDDASAQTTSSATNLGEGDYIVTVSDDFGYTDTASVSVIVLDNIDPTVSVSDIIVFLDTNGEATIETSDIDNGSTDDCEIATMSLDATSFDCTHIGDNTVTLTVTDTKGNTASAQATVTVLDDLAPVVITRDTTIFLDAVGSAMITTNDIDNGSSDNCGITSYSLDISAFDCSNIGPNTVSLTVTDEEGNSDTQNATVRIRDTLSPTVITQDITVTLNTSGLATIDTDDIDNGSSDNCSIQSMSLDITSFDCSNVGANTVVLTVTDVNGNMNTATATVTVLDDVAPLALTQNIVLELDDMGMATITAADIDAGSTDNCGIAGLSLDQTSFDCSNLGINTVTLTVTDGSGLTASATATVRVLDLIQPTMTCPADISVTNDAGTVTAIVNYSLPVVNDNCASPSLTLLSGPASGSAFPLGVTTVSYEVVDAAGNKATCSFNVIVTYGNEQPTFSATDPITVSEDAGFVQQLGWATFAPTTATVINGREATQAAIKYDVTNVSNSALFNSLPEVASDGTLRFTLAPDASGSTNFTVTVQDNGGTENGGVDVSAPQTFTLTVNEINDAPTMDDISDFSVDATAQTQIAVTGITTGAEVEDQTLTLTATSSQTNIISTIEVTYSSPDQQAVLSFASLPNQTGEVTITVTLSDDGGMANGGVDQTTQTFTVSVDQSAELFIPQLFTPNGDGINDNLTVMGNGISTIDFKVFDPEGNLVYETQDVVEATTIGWDGKSGGTDQPGGVYTWSLSGTMADQSNFNIRSAISNTGLILLSR